ncbi:hypothetical protein L195_g035445 [Trifolium pratense]|uniref:Uncharacterized protein n=1 Tax=Trifolium pratense TaxID=57577 RepID=A0A2K3LLR9_TRIPR|nr:hypothetical protein L195_g035445 [Trifolium pratense]
MLGKFYSDLLCQIATENKIVGVEVPGYSTEIIGGPQHNDDVVSCFSDILRLLDFAPSAKFGASSLMVVIVAPDSQGVMTLFRELKEIFSMSAGVDSFDQATITKAQSLVEQLRPLLFQNWIALLYPIFDPSSTDKLTQGVQQSNPVLKKKGSKSFYKDCALVMVA